MKIVKDPPFHVFWIPILLLWIALIAENPINYVLAYSSMIVQIIILYSYSRFLSKKMEIKLIWLDKIRRKKRLAEFRKNK